jgi:hypothetical protein
MKTLAAALALYFLTFVLEGPLRYVLALASFETALYARDAVLLSAIILATLRHLRRPLSMYVVGMLFLLSFHSLTGVLFTAQPLQVAFGLKMILPFVLGVVIYKWARLESRALHATVLFFFVVTVTGIFLNYFQPFDWEGFSYRIGETNVQGAVRWWHDGGQKRLAGFARSSYDAAILVVACATFLAIYIRNVPGKLLLWAVAGFAIVLTTTKGALFAYAVLSLFFAVRMRLGRNGHSWALGFLWLPAGIMILLPVYSGVLDVRLDFDSPIERLLLGSYAERMENVWPRAFENLGQAGSFMIGRGIGGIGTPQLYFEPALWNFADNLFVFIYSTCGIIAFAYIFFFLWQAQGLKLRRSVDALTYANLMFALIYGITTAVLENAVIAFLLGLACGKLLESYSRRQHDLALSGNNGALPKNPGNFPSAFL